ncbi:MAG: hypothetical protein EA401_07565 [Planctomycetota bacterium]|nr:MAG: hypothetical protein EA401_07565 [Planctomycetota bacterium]
MAETHDDTPASGSEIQDSATDATDNGNGVINDLDINLLVDYGVQYSENIVGAILVLVVGWMVARFVSRTLYHTLEKREKIDPQVRSLAVRIVRGLILLITIIAVLGKFGVQTASIVAVLGGLGLAVGLALQGSLSNVASGVMLMVIRPFSIGQVIKTGGEFYIIDDIGLIATSAHLPDGPKVIIPNNRLWGSEIVNLSVIHNNLRRLDENFGISYTDDIDRAFAIIRSVLDADPRYLHEPDRLLAVTSLDDSSVNVLCRVWVKPEDWWFAKLDLIKNVKQAFDREGITIPFPQRDVHLIQEGASQSH